MDAVTCTELKADQALAKRWLRTGLLPLPVWQWLAGRQVALQDHLPPASNLLVDALKAFAIPLGSHLGDQQRQALDTCLADVARLISLCHRTSTGPALHCQHRMLAACLLPLYRGLASGGVTEVTSVLRRQLADSFSLAATLTEFRDELPELLCGAATEEASPYERIKNVLQVELEQLTQVLLCTSAKWDGRDAVQLDSLVRQEAKIDWRPPWGQSAVLWRLAGELISQRAEFVVPRDWIAVPVPWNEASEHWLDVMHALENAPLPSSPATQSSANNHESQAAGVALNFDRNIDKSVDKSAQAIDQVMASQSSLEMPTSSAASTTNANAIGGSAESSGDDIQRLKLEIEIADAIDSLVQASRHATGNAVGNRTDGSHPPQSPRPRNEEFVVPKVIIAEVRSHNDPAFVSVVRRHLALCRTELRTMSLLAVMVIPEGEEGHVPSLQSLGLASWQQKLVNWLSEHPEIHDPYAFISNEGELILSLMDIERNTATPILRQGLTEILSGATENAATLNRATAPARYHSGIASVSSPAVSFEPEQLIEATYRCLEAATRLGKASIKSIEVF